MQARTNAVWGKRLRGLSVACAVLLAGACLDVFVQAELLGQQHYGFQGQQN